MRIGVRAHDYGKNTPEGLVTKIKEVGFEAVQLAIPKAISGIDTFDQITPELLKKIHEVFKKSDIELSVFGCYIEPALLDKEARMGQVSRFLKALEYSKTIDALLVGTETTHFTTDESERPKAFEALVDSVQRMVEKAEEIDAIVGIEPVSVHTLNTPELTYKLLQRVKSNHLKIIFDPVNLLTFENSKNQEGLWKECFEAFGAEIEAIHVKNVIIENNAFKHVLLEDGLVDYQFLFNWFNTHKSHVSVLRENADPQTAYRDVAFLKQKIV
ncbi:sugar phosphate isomerase/epimerase family protein [Cellulosilyticum sp. I15G10I2]|uniref:sugar phosphate isomerase/epimerase family protein n=1 Tax=Cellulosilyticum sp. I15G10I2 TaxID=1892843 RepID=UPI00085BF331|nr:TIM barrel protein [Cellulosilyticum sp. I15G10I2]